MSKVVLLIGLGYGDESKGSVVDYLTRQHADAKTIVRFNGGANAAHNVVLPGGQHHTFSQFGSGSFVPGVETYLSRHMLVNPGALLNEGEHLRSLGLNDIFRRMVIDRDALITNPFQQAANRIREVSRGEDRHGSCGMGIGETRADALDGYELFVRDLVSPKILKRKLEESRQRKLHDLRHLVDDSFFIQREWRFLTDPKSVGEVMERFTQFLASPVRFQDERYLQGRVKQGTTIFEGAQGVLLDQDYGFAPYTTWSDCTFTNALQILEGCNADVIKMGVIRAYATRHGAGPMPTEDPELELADEHNGYGEWQRDFRVGHFDSVMLKYAMKVIGGVDQIALTCLDRCPGERRVCVGYKIPKEPAFEELIVHHPKVPHDEDHQAQQASIADRLFEVEPIYETVSSVEVLSAALPVTIRSYGPTADDKKGPRIWQSSTKRFGAG